MGKSTFRDHGQSLSLSEEEADLKQDRGADLQFFSVQLKKASPFFQSTFVYFAENLTNSKVKMLQLFKMYATTPSFTKVPFTLFEQALSQIPTV